MQVSIFKVFPVTMMKATAMSGTGNPLQPPALLERDQLLLMQTLTQRDTRVWDSSLKPQPMPDSVTEQHTD